MLSVYLVTASGHVSGQDQEYFFRTAQAIAGAGTFAIEPLGLGDREAGKRDEGGRFYAQYAPGWPIALAASIRASAPLADTLDPIVRHYRWLHDSRAPAPDIAARFFASYANILVSAGLAAVIAAVVLRLGHPPLVAFIASSGFALGSFAWGQSRMLFAEPLQTLLLVAVFGCLLSHRPANAWGAGTLVAVAMLVKLTSSLVIPALLLLPGPAGTRLWRNPSLAVPMVVGAAVGLLGHGVFNALRFGSPFITGYTSSAGGGVDFGGNPLVGVVGLILSPGRGILWFAPPVILAAILAPRFLDRHRQLGLPIGVLVATWVTFHAFWRDWDSGWGWGPRYLLTVLPFILLPLAVIPLRQTAWRVGLGLVMLAGVVVQIPGASVEFMESGRERGRDFSVTCPGCTERQLIEWINFNPAGSELVHHTRLFLGGRWDFAWQSFEGTPVPLMTWAAAFAAATSGWLLALRSGVSILPNVPMTPRNPETDTPRRPKKRERQARRMR